MPILDTENKRDVKINGHVDKNLLLDLIREKAPISVYALQRICGLGYSTLWRSIREFEFAGLIETSLLDNPERQQRIINLPRMERKNE